LQTQPVRCALLSRIFLGRFGPVEGGKAAHADGVAFKLDDWLHISYQKKKIISIFLTSWELHKKPPQQKKLGYKGVALPYNEKRDEPNFRTRFLLFLDFLVCRD
jgi:hypothetical protein